MEGDEELKEAVDLLLLKRDQLSGEDVAFLEAVRESIEETGAITGSAGCLIIFDMLVRIKKATKEGGVTNG